MLICIDVRAAARGRKTGVEEYIKNLIENLIEIKKADDKIILFNASWKQPNLSFLSKETLKKVEILHFKIPYKLLTALRLIRPLLPLDKLVEKRLKHKIDIFVSPNLASIVPLSKNTKKVVVVHDLSLLRFPEFFRLKDRLFYKYINLKYELQSSAAIIAVSESTKEDILEFFPQINSDKVHRIYSGINKAFLKSPTEQDLNTTKTKYALPEKFILYLGTLEPRKNISSIIDAFEIYKEFYPNDDINLIISGSSGWKNQELYKKIKYSKYNNAIKIIGFVDEKDKPTLYKLAKIFIYPSFFEGFGFPPLEAIISGVPTIVSNNSSLSEIVKDHAIMINAYKPKEIFYALRAILQEGFQKHPIEKIDFNWQKTANETYNLFKTLI